MTNVLSFDRATVVRGERRILEDVTWRTRDGEHWVVLGPNGAGKTTLVRAACARVPLTSGSIALDGAPVDRIAPAERGTRLSLASSAGAARIRGAQSARDTGRSAAWGVHVAHHEHYEGQDEERARDLMAAFGVSHLADHPFGSLSEGEAQRVQLARALMSDPEVLILDEPTAGLDLGARETLVSALDEIIAGKRSPQVVLVTHQIEEIPTGITHCAVMRGGALIAQGPIADTLTGVVLSEAFSLPLLAGMADGRWWARAASSQD